MLGSYTPQALIQDRQRHTFLRAFQSPNYMKSSRRFPYNSHPSMNPNALGINLDAKHKINVLKNPHTSKDQHVSSNRHVKTKKIWIQK